MENCCWHIVELKPRECMKSPKHRETLTTFKTQLSSSKQNRQVVKDFEVNDLEEFPLWCGIPQSSLATGGTLLAPGCGLLTGFSLSQSENHVSTHSPLPGPVTPLPLFLLPFSLALQAYHSI